MTKRDKRAHGNGSSEHWTKMIRHTMEEPAWQALSSTAQALYPWLKFEWRGPEANNNGKLRLSVRQAAMRLGVRPDTAAEAFRDLQRKGFIVQTEHAYLGTDGAAKAPAYELTELKMPAAERDGRKLYRDWRPGNDFPVQSSPPNNPRGSNGQKTKPRHENRDGAVPKTVTNWGRPVTESVTTRPENRDENGMGRSQTVTESVTSLSYHTSGTADGVSPRKPKAGATRTRAEVAALLRDTSRRMPGNDDGGPTIDLDPAEVRHV